MLYPGKINEMLLQHEASIRILDSLRKSTRERKYKMKMEWNRKWKKLKNTFLNEFFSHAFQIYFSSFISYTKNEELKNT